MDPAVAQALPTPLTCFRGNGLIDGKATSDKMAGRLPMNANLKIDYSAACHAVVRGGGSISVHSRLESATRGAERLHPAIELRHRWDVPGSRLLLHVSAGLALRRNSRGRRGAVQSGPPPDGGNKHALSTCHRFRERFLRRCPSWLPAPAFPRFAFAGLPPSPLIPRTMADKTARQVCVLAVRRSYCSR